MIDYFSTIVNIQGYTIPGTGIFFDLPSVGGWFSKGVFSAIGQGMAIFLAVLVLVWVGFALYGAFSIISSMGDPQKIEKGWKTIKSIWIGISYFLIFFALIGLLAVFMGIGYPWDWAENLQQCDVGGPAGGRFYFQGKFEPSVTDPGDFDRLTYSDMLANYRKTNPFAEYMRVYCCEDADKEYITVGLSNTAPSGCEINNTIKVFDAPGGSCQASSQICDPVSPNCCSGLVCDGPFGGGVYRCV